VIVRLSFDVSEPLTSLGYFESRNLAPEAPIKPKTGKNAPHQ
jgi:hypothetical protein